MLCLATITEETMPESAISTASSPGVKSQDSESHPDSGFAGALPAGSAQGVPVVDRKVPESILAFRTISVFLSQVHPKQDPQPLPALSKEIDEQLKISDSFAHISVIHRDVVALATKRTFHGHVNILAFPSAGQDTDSAATPGEAMLSADDATTPAETDDRSGLVTETHATPSRTAGLSGSVASFIKPAPEPSQEAIQIQKTQVIVSRNTHEDDIRENPDLRNNSLYPKIVETTAPKDIGAQRPEDYVCSLLSKW